MSTEPESFLARWSRQKRAAERIKEQPAERVAPQTPAAPPVKEGAEAAGLGPSGVPSHNAAPAPEIPLPPIESLDGLRSDYQAFFQQPVAEDLRHAALKKLFADPHFNQMDMLDVYVDDYTQFEPLPAAMRLRLPSARLFLLDSERTALEATETPASVAGDVPETAASAADAERGDAASADAGATPGLSADEASVEPDSALTAAPDAAPLNAPSEQDKSADVASSSPVHGRAIAGDPSSS